MHDLMITTLHANGLDMPPLRLMYFFKLKEPKCLDK